tara:strand:+ start:4115 stop:5107 length:993 start_codon:yes stop_codon:yes gene_type:complete
MAKSATFQTKQNTSVVIGTEVTMGTATVAAGTTLEVPVTDYSFDEIKKHSLSVAPPRTGSGAFTQSDDMVKWQRHDRMFEVSITFHSTAQMLDRICLALFGDGATPNALLGSMPAVVDYRHGQSNTTPVTLWFENAGHDGEGVDQYFTSCLCTGLTLTGSIGGDGGVVMGTATFQTAYAPTQGALTFTGGTHTLLTAQTTMFNMHDLATTTLDSEDLLLYGFDVAIARPVNRIGFDGATFVPMGYSVGGYEVTGNITCKRDGEVDDAIDNTAGMALDIDTGVFQITGSKVFVDGSGISMDEDGWKQTIPLRFTYDSAATSNPVITIGTAA